MSDDPESIKAQVAQALAQLAKAEEERPPHIDDAGFTVEEREHVTTIWLVLNSMNSIIDDFEASITLFHRFVLSPDPGERRWAFFATRNAAMLLYDFRESLGALNRAVRSCAPVSSPERRHALASIKGRFNHTFSQHGEARAVAGHPVGSISTPDARRIHSVRGMVYVNNVFGDLAISSRQGRFVQFRLGSETVEQLRAFRKAIFDSFR